MTQSLLAIAAAVAIGFAVSAVLTLRLARIPLLLDRPNDRSLHRAVVPRSGGIAVLIGAACAASVSALLPTAGGGWGWIVGASLLVAGVSFLDDRDEVRPLYRLAAHLAAPLLLVTGGIVWRQLELPGLSWPIPPGMGVLLTVLFVGWMINLYNFMDGMDGLAGGMAVFGFSALAAVAWPADPEYALVNAAIAASAAGFLIGNFPPARIFLGDVGSATLGLLAASSALVGSGRGLFPLWVAWLAFSPFIVDATWTLLRRLLRGERLWEAHRSHHYQRLVLAGWSHRKTLLRYYLLMAACAATAVASVGMNEADQGLLLGAWALIYLLLGFRVRLAERTSGSVST
jgi:UDP-N-acetylmuramyl pentapeptide phosphotransferase/UDP-N-acetylglucosamine-1-phosphate transferase